MCTKHKIHIIGKFLIINRKRSSEKSCLYIILYLNFQVAVRVRTPDGEEKWILAEVVSFNPSTNKYPFSDTTCDSIKITKKCFETDF